jgi:thioredoxin-related protein
MNNIIFKILRVTVLILTAILLPLNVVHARDLDDGNLQHEDYPSWFKKDPFLELDVELYKARQAGKKGLMVLYTTKGCSYCDVFIQKSLGDPLIAAMVQAQFDAVGLEIFDDKGMVDPSGTNMSVKKFASFEGVEFSPTLLFYGEGGERLLKVTGYQSPTRFKQILGYLAGEYYKTVSLASYFRKYAENNAATTLSTSSREDSLFGKPPHILQRNYFTASQPMMVLFEATACEECNNFHDKVLAEKEVRDALAKFKVIRLDANDDKTIVLAPDGSRITPVQWYKKIGFSRLPALVFIDEKGNEVLKTDALILKQRMMNCVNYVLEKAYEKNWTYQRFARSKAIERSLNKKMHKSN